MRDAVLLLLYVAGGFAGIGCALMKRYREAYVILLIALSVVTAFAVLSE